MSYVLCFGKLNGCNDDVLDAIRLTRGSIDGIKRGNAPVVGENPDLVEELRKAVVERNALRAELSFFYENLDETVGDAMRMWLDTDEGVRVSAAMLEMLGLGLDETETEETQA